MGNGKKKLIDARRKNRELFVCALNWLKLLEAGTDLSVYFKQHGCKKIAIYGAGELAEVLLQEFVKYPDIHITHLIDQSAASNREKYGFPVYLP